MAGSRSLVAAFLAVFLALASAARGNNYTTTAQQNAGVSWNTGSIWSNGLAPSAGNTYEMLAGGNPTRVRNPALPGIQTFPGDWLKVDADAEIRMKGTGTTLNFPGVSGQPGLILNGG